MSRPIFGVAAWGGCSWLPMTLLVFCRAILGLAWRGILARRVLESEFVGFRAFRRRWAVFSERTSFGRVLRLVIDRGMGSLGREFSCVVVSACGWEWGNKCSLR